MILRSLKKSKQNLTEEFNERLAYTAVFEFGCDEQCINLCTSFTYADFTKVPSCISGCACSEDNINLTQTGTYDYSSLL